MPPDMVPFMSIVPTEPFMLYKAAQIAGCTIHPSNSLPMLKAENPAAVPTAEPNQEPPGVYKISGQQTLKINEILGLRYGPAICR